ncbi:MAG TPA: hypothetical protein VMR52_07265 [Dehalococcoidia bacterium]|nr:hypothetical protein [Dehalococcoidia bacterium]
MSNITRTLKLARHWFWLAPLVLGIVFVGSGIYMVVEGRAAHNDVRDTIIQEEITVADDAPAFGGEVIDSPGKAQAQSDAILEHTLAGSGGYLYAQQGRFLLPEGSYMLTRGTFMAASGDGVTTDVSSALTDDDGNPVNVTTDESLAAKDASDRPVRAWTNNGELAAKDANGSPIANPLRNTALTSANLRTGLGVAVMGFKVSDLVSGLGLFMIVIGVTHILFLAPATYYAAELANEREGLIEKKAKALEQEQARQPQV